MLQFPKATVLNKNMPKEAFYRNLILSTDMKEKFVSDIKKVVWQNKLTSQTLHISESENIKEILVLSVELKKRELDYKIIETIAKQNAHNILFVIMFESNIQIAAYHTKLYKTEWQSQERAELKMKGYTLDDIWSGFISQISSVELAAGQSLDVQLQMHERKQNLQKQIEQLERQARNEKQPKKKFELVRQVNKLRNELEELD